MASPNPFPAGISKEQAFSMAQTEMEYRVELFNKYLNQSLILCFYIIRDLIDAPTFILVSRIGLAQTCFSKCVDKRYKEAELNMGDNSCIDRCVSKYWQVNGMVGQLLSAGKPPM
uniref:Mitochondrial import inner membrane translocase subunit n=1 Tax=Brassica campestris TaxID=3711 RepID=A0A3P6D0A1_BRACM|nr:unnamed protein product [Brassica rapa]